MSFGWFSFNSSLAGGVCRVALVLFIDTITCTNLSHIGLGFVFPCHSLSPFPLSSLSCCLQLHTERVRLQLGIPQLLGHDVEPYRLPIGWCDNPCSMTQYTNPHGTNVSRGYYACINQRSAAVCLFVFLLVCLLACLFVCACFSAA